MTTTRELALLTVPLAILASTTQSAYRETMAPSSLTKNLRDDYGLVDDNAEANQSETFQKAIDDLAASGGGRLIVPKGSYRLSGVYLKSNVHMLIERDAVIKPHWPKGTKVVVFNGDRSARIVEVRIHGE